jgi:aspartate aminotransferase
MREMVKMAEATPVEAPTSVESDFKITPEQLEAAILHKNQTDYVQFAM